MAGNHNGAYPVQDQGTVSKHGPSSFTNLTLYRVMDEHITAMMRLRDL